MVSAELKRQSGRYLVIGLCCAVLNNVILIGADFAGLHYVSATLLTFATTVPLAYLAHATWSFSAERSWRAFGRFVLGSISSLLVAAAAIAFFCGALDLPMIVGAPSATLAMTVYNFLMARWAVTNRL